VKTEIINLMKKYKFNAAAEELARSSLSENSPMLARIRLEWHVFDRSQQGTA
jgi:hypothetical protein